MIKKEITMKDGKTYTVGFKEVGSNKDGLECHILNEELIISKSIYSKFYLKGISPDYQYLAFSTIHSYIIDCQQKEKLIAETWS